MIETKAYEKLLHENNELQHLIHQFKSLLDSIPDPVFMKDENLRWIYGNPVILNLYSIDKDNYIGKTEDQLLPKEFADSCMESDRKAVEKRSISKSEEQARDENDALHYYEVFKVPSYDKETGAFSGLIGIGRDVTKRKEIQQALEEENIIRKEHEEKLATLTQTLEKQVKERTLELEREKEKAIRFSYVDTLTDINNRRAYYIKSLAVDEDARKGLSHYSIIMLDIDYFKKINDAYGHALGDEVLKSVGTLLKKYVKDANIEGRIGGEEFAITLINTKLDEATVIADLLCTEISKITLSHHNDFKMTASFGISEYHPLSNSFEEILNCADQALFQAKESGRNRVLSKTYA